MYEDFGERSTAVSKFHHCRCSPTFESGKDIQATICLSGLAVRCQHSREQTSLTNTGFLQVKLGSPRWRYRGPRLSSAAAVRSFSVIRDTDSRQATSQVPRFRLDGPALQRDERLRSIDFAGCLRCELAWAAWLVEHESSNLFNHSKIHVVRRDGLSAEGLISRTTDHDDEEKDRVYWCEFISSSWDCLSRTRLQCTGEWF